MNERSDDKSQDSDDDKALFEAAVSDARRLVNEHRVPQPVRTRPRARRRREEERAVLRDSLEAEFDPREIDSDDSLRFARASVGKRTMRKLARGGFSVQSELDLHGMNSDEAHDALQDFIQDASLRGFTCVRIVHGKGLGSGQRGPVLKRKVAALLRRWRQVLAFVSARQVDGGTGAVYVLLERDRP